MDREKQIEEMARLLEESYGICGNFSGCTNRKCPQCYAETLYNAGYRKSEDVCEETIKEAAYWLDNEKGFCGLGYMLKQKYGVEVEE